MLLHVDLIDIMVVVNSIAIYYNSILVKKCVEVMFFDSEKKIEKVIAHYTD